LLICFSAPDDPGADLVDAVAEPDRRQMLVVDAAEVLLGEPAFADQGLVDALVERLIVAGGVGVPDLEIARSGLVPQRPDLTQGGFGIGERASKLVVIAHY
jgi:hypothetical protein